jgi:Phospholipase D Active site motif
MLPVRPLNGEYQRPDLRNHRKLVVVDGFVGFTGSQNLIDRTDRDRRSRTKQTPLSTLASQPTNPWTCSSPPAPSSGSRGWFRPPPWSHSRWASTSTMSSTEV